MRRFFWTFCHILTAHAPLGMLLAPPNANAQTPQESGIPAQKISSLRSAVLPDLRKAVAKTLNMPGIKDVDKQFKECTISPLQLGTLGSAVVVTWNPFNAPNASMIAVYLPEGSRFRKIAQGVGFGPRILKTEGIPDLMFGVAGGVCHATYFRYRYHGNAYRVDACDQENEGEAGGDCVISRCQGSLPTFPSTFLNP
jgi:hypothetical protein